MPNVRRQSTLRRATTCKGISLHGGSDTSITLHPAQPDTGLVFRRTDVTDRHNLIRVDALAVTGVRNCTTISNAARIGVSTIEHLLAALCAAGVDNLVIDIDGPELPALDGSAEPFLKLVEQAGLKRQAAPRHYIRVLETVEIEDGYASARIEPCERFEIDVSIDFDDAAIGRQRLQIAPNVQAFRNRIASARTFARKHEVAALQAAGLSKGGSYDNAILVDGDSVLNPGGLRFDDEFVRHKALDLMGDMYIGGPILGRVVTSRSGHGLNHDLLVKLFATRSAWERVALPGSRALVAMLGDRERTSSGSAPAIAVPA